MFEIAVGELSATGSKGIELHRLIATRHYFLRTCGDTFRIISVSIPAIGIYFDPVTDLTAYKFVNGFARRFADNIPECGLNSRHSRIHNGTGIVFNLIKLEPDVLDIERIVAHQIAFAKI